MAHEDQQPRTGHAGEVFASRWRQSADRAELITANFSGCFVPPAGADDGVPDGLREKADG